MPVLLTGAKQPLWHTHHDFYQQARHHVAEFKQRQGRLPTADEFRRFALSILGRSSRTDATRSLNP